MDLSFLHSVSVLGQSASEKQAMEYSNPIVKWILHAASKCSGLQFLSFTPWSFNFRLIF